MGNEESSFDMNTAQQVATPNAWVYYGRTHRTLGETFVEQLRQSREYALVTPCNVRYYAGEVHRGAHVYHDGTRRDLVWANEREGVEVRQFAGDAVMDAPADLAPPAPEPEPAPIPTGPRPTEEVIQRGRWFVAMRDGEKVGKAKRSPEHAWALLRDEAV